LHFNGADTATTFTDENSLITWTAVGGAQLDTAEKKFGTAAGLFNGTTDWVTSDTALSTGEAEGGLEWSIWFNMDVTGANECLVGTEGGYGAHIVIDQIAEYLRLDLSSNGSSHDIANGTKSTTTVIAVDTWYRARLAWDGATYKLYLSNNGAEETEEVSVTSAVPCWSGKLIIADDGTGTRDFDGHLDEFKWSCHPVTLGVETPSASEHPALAEETEHWFDTSEMKMKESVSGTWTDSTRVFLGEAVADGSSVTSAVTYGIKGEYETEYAVANNTSYTKSDNLGSAGKMVDLYYRESPSFIWEKMVSLADDGAGEIGAVVGVVNRNSSKARTGVTYINSAGSANLGSASTITQTAGYHKLKVRRDW